MVEDLEHAHRVELAGFEQSGLHDSRHNSVVNSGWRGRDRFVARLNAADRPVTLRKRLFEHEPAAAADLQEAPTERPTLGFGEGAAVSAPQVWNFRRIVEAAPLIETGEAGPSRGPIPAPAPA